MIVPLLAATLSLGACQADQMGTKQTVGTLGGAVAGGFLGNQIGGGSGRVVATAAGAVLGAWLGNEIGASLDKADQQALGSAQQEAYAAPIGQSISWNNPDSGHYGTVTPVRDGYASSGAYCREYQHTVTINGQSQNAYGTACQQPDGSWKIVN